MTKGDVIWTYTYNNAGLRTGRSGTNGTSYKYVYNGSQLVQMTITTNGTTKVVDFTYDASGSPLTMKYGGNTYYYVVNLQGDVTGILDSNGDPILVYVYTAYGQGAYITYNTQLAPELAAINPLCYRGYVLDMGTGLYYLQSRYYDPVVGRFINADGLVSTGQGLLGNNMFAYCGNNPVNRADINGYAWGLTDISALIETLVSRIADLIEFLTNKHNDSIPQTDGYKYSFYADLSLDSEFENLKANCLGVALLKNVEAKLRYYYPGASSFYIYLCFANIVGNDNARIISSPNAPISSDEYIIALKGGQTDYHFMLKTMYGWYNKPGTLDGSYIDREIVYGDIWPYFYDSDLDYNSPFRYDDETIYVAVKIGWDE